MQRSLPALIALVLLFSTVGWSADFWKGFKAYQRNDYATALREWRPLAEQGHANAQSMLGVMCGEGKAIPQNMVYAHMWLSVAASQGHEIAAEGRDLAAKTMTPSQIEKAQDLASECVEKKYKGCD